MEENRSNGVLLAFLPVLVLAAGGLIMFAGGYEGHGLTPNFLQTVGLIVSIVGAGWSLFIIGRAIITAIRNGIRALFKPKQQNP